MGGLRQSVFFTKFKNSLLILVATVREKGGLILIIFLCFFVVLFVFWYVRLNFLADLSADC